MKKAIIAFLVALGITTYPASLARADLFGGDVVVLSQILIQAIQQLNQLRMILKAGSDNLDLVRDINRGINDSLNLIRTISPNTDPGVLRELQKVSDAVRVLADIYGDVVQTKDARAQRTADQTVAEAVTLNNSIYDYTNQIDQIGEQIKSYSHSVSPGGAQKLTAQSLGVMLHVMNQSLRAQATSLKLQAQVVAMQNHKDKEASRETVELGDSMKIALDKQAPKFETPRF